MTLLTRCSPLFRKCALPVLSLLAAQSLTSCATIVTGAYKKVQITSNPYGARIFVNDKPHGVTPATVTLSNWNAARIRIELEGYDPYEEQIRRSFNAWVFGNILIGGLIGIGVDIMTGAVYAIDTDGVHHDFRREMTRADGAEGDRLFVVLVKKPEPQWKPIGQLVRSGNAGDKLRVQREEGGR